jgi:VIT1/CCC1 family predicted Fe2+/Mn2+ transporter
LHALRKSTDPARACQIIAASLASVIASVMKPDEFETIHRRLAELPEPTERSRIRRKDWLGAVGIFFLVVLSTFPVAIPFIFIEKVALAMRVSNGIAIVMLFALGFTFGRIIERNPLRIGLAMVALGALLVAITIALGG